MTLATSFYFENDECRLALQCDSLESLSSADIPVEDFEIVPEDGKGMGVRYIGRKRVNRDKILIIGWGYSKYTKNVMSFG